MAELAPPRERPDAPTDAYLDWGRATGFRYLTLGTGRAHAAGDVDVDPRTGQPHRIGLLVAWRTDDGRPRIPDPALLKALEVELPAVYQPPSPARVERPGDRVPSAGAGRPAPAAGSPAGGPSASPPRFCALSIPPARLDDFLAEAGAFIAQVELAAAIAPSATPRIAMGVPAGRLLLGVLDDGCAFANGRLMQGARTTVQWLWDQSPTAVLQLRVLPGADFGYGRQFLPGDLDDLLAQAGGRPQRAYAEARMPGLRRAAVHGTHVADLFFGRAAAGETEGAAAGLQVGGGAGAGAAEVGSGAAEVGPSDDTAPANAPAPLPDPAVAFVQFPPAALDDPSGRWLGRQALDGLHFVLACAGPTTEKVVVNLSWGPQTGPHDGSSLLERAIDDLVQRERDNGRDLLITLPAGNSFAARAHAQVPYRVGGSLTWVVPPDGQVPAFLEIWWPGGVGPGDIALTVRTPTGDDVPIVQGNPARGPEEADTPAWLGLKQVGGQTMALLAIAPTGGPPGARGAHGRWHIGFGAGAGATATDAVVQVYVARADHNMGARRRARASMLTDPALDAARFRPPADREREAPGSAVRRAGTLNGLATGRLTKVAGGYRASDRQPAPYASSGPARAGTRTGPDFAFRTDASRTVQGLRAAGVRTGTTVRLVGTSTAAPQYARWFAENDSRTPPPVHAPTGDDPRLGGGCVKR